MENFALCLFVFYLLKTGEQTSQGLQSSDRVLKGGCPRGGGSWGTLRIPREDWGTVGKIRGITTPPLRILLIQGLQSTYN